ncbi:MAG: lytic transglycosylase domain-containing protein, partial [Bacteroidetes bacterium]|nr:lytic transglycosylase domain-containing protein [Bacteroidota bacterium]
MNKPLSYYTIALAAVLTAAIFASYSDQPAEQISLDNTAIPQVIKPVDLDRPFDFAGERL